jgi:hypothetical protein
MPVVVSSEGDGGKVQRPEAIVDFFEADLFAGERFAEKQSSAAPRDLADAGDATDFEMSWIDDRRQSTRQRAA